jgi:hypothetical protein
MKYLLIGLLKLYRLVISPLYGNVCRWRCDGCCAATRGPRVGMTPYREPLNSTKRCENKHGAQQKWMRVPSWRRNEV